MNLVRNHIIYVSTIYVHICVSNMEVSNAYSETKNRRKSHTAK